MVFRKGLLAFVSRKGFFNSVYRIRVSEYGFQDRVSGHCFQDKVFGHSFQNRVSGYGFQERSLNLVSRTGFLNLVSGKGFRTFFPGYGFWIWFPLISINSVMHSEQATQADGLVRQLYAIIVYIHQKGTKNLASGLWFSSHGLTKHCHKQCCEKLYTFIPQTFKMEKIQ